MAATAVAWVKSRERWSVLLSQLDAEEYGLIEDLLCSGISRWRLIDCESGMSHPMPWPCRRAHRVVLLPFSWVSSLCSGFNFCRQLRTQREIPCASCFLAFIFCWIQLDPQTERVKFQFVLNFPQKKCQLTRKFLYRLDWNRGWWWRKSQRETLFKTLEDARVIIGYLHFNRRRQMVFRRADFFPTVSVRQSFVQPIFLKIPSLYE